MYRDARTRYAKINKGEAENSRVGCVGEVVGRMAPEILGEGRICEVFFERGRRECFVFLGDERSRRSAHFS